MVDPLELVDIYLEQMKRRRMREGLIDHSSTGGYFLSC